MIFLGIDPGKLGGLAAIDDHGIVVAITKMPATPEALYCWLRDLAAAGPVRATVEHVAAWAPPGMRMGVTSAFTFGRGVGNLEMALIACGMPITRVAPRKWQANLGCPNLHGDKNITKARATALFPQLTVTHAIADALLLAVYGRRQLIGGVMAYSAKGFPDGKKETRTEEEGQQARPAQRRVAGPRRRAASAAR